jgi:C4-dicarboxylate-specific signal transduction histidine kinase
MNAFHPEDRAEEEWRAAFAAEEPFEKEARLRRADRAYRWFLLRAAPLRDERGNVVKWYGTTTDIEDRRRAEEALQEAQGKLAHVTRAVAMGELAAAIAHEVNQPLTAIVTNANFSLLELKGSTENLDELRTAITEIVNDATRASAVISRIRGLLVKGSPRRTELDINKIIQEVITLLRNELSRNRVSLRTDFASNLPRVTGDPVQLQQVLINLIVNAIEAMRTSTDRTRELRIRSANNADGILVQVQDSGPGIAPELADHIFEPFFTTKAEGTGMGLSISRSIIESHGGQLSIVPGSQGAVFQFTLPVDSQ